MLSGLIAIGISLGIMLVVAAVFGLYTASCRYAWESTTPTVLEVMMIAFALLMLMPCFGFMMAGTTKIINSL